MHRGARTISLFLIIVLAYYISCSRDTGYKVLSTVFDGVPEPEEKSKEARFDSLNQDTVAVLTETASAKRIRMTFHEPYLDKDCASCHDENQMGKLVKDQPGLCYQCHDNFKAENEYLHGPVQGGYCTNCHSPHKAPSKDLLLRTGEDLCLDCHDGKAVKENIVHKNIEKENCVECHSPHGGENRYILRSKQCYKCHDDFKETYSFLHGPVGGEYCATCHEPHASGSENLLSKTGRDLCLNCHDLKQVEKNDSHKGIENKDCLECHSPHGGENKFILN